MIRILVADPLDKQGLKMIEEVGGVSYDVKTGLTEDQLAAAVGEYDGLIVRSGVKVTAKVLASPGRLKAIARAGVGVDNIDVPAATRAGILVMNTPDANTISTAEQTMALMLAMCRHVPRADAHVRAGEWNRKAFVGVQLAGKTLGIIGLGRVGSAVARRALAFDMKVVAYDPFYSSKTALDGQVAMADSAAEVFAQADFLTFHVKLTDETRNMVCRASIAGMKDGVRIVNSSRGGVINETDLAEALKSGKVAAAAVDVYSSEPPAADNPLLTAPNMVLAPHLGASTEEAQLAVTLDAVDILLKYLLKGEIRWAVNVSGLPGQLSDREKAYLDLATRMGTILSRLGSGVIEEVRVTTHGESLAPLVGAFQKQVLAAVLAPHFNTRVNVINVDAFARERGIRVEQSADMAVSAITDSVTVRMKTREGEHEVVGEVFLDGRPRIMAVNGYQMNLVPEGEMVMIFNDDQPGVIGLVGTVFGDRRINVADMMLSRRDRSALMVLKLDAPMPMAVQKDLEGRCPPINRVLPLTLPTLNG